MPLKIKRQFPYTERELHIRSGCDEKFDAAMRAHDKANAQLEAASRECIFQAARKLLAAAKMFGDDTNVFVKQLREAINAKDIVHMTTPLSLTLREHPIASNMGDPTVRDFLVACQCLLDACGELSNHAAIQLDSPLMSAYHDSVRCRAHLKWAGE